MINYYVDPGSGFVFAQSASFLWAIILGLLGGFFIFFKLCFRFLNKFLWVIFILLAALIIGGLIMHKETNAKKIIILGIDAMDPNITEKLIKEGRLPNLSSLRSAGSYSRLSTTIPAESVVAWTSFATGLNPGNHGIFDFIMRNPNNYSPYLSLNEVSTVKGRIKIMIRRKGETFWNILSKNKIPSFIYFCPNTFPPERILGRTLSGMGTPDILGTMGKSSFYTTKILAEENNDNRVKVIQVNNDNGLIVSELYGPKLSSGTSQTESRVPLRIVLKPAEEKISIGFQGQNILLNKGTWSNWLKVSFKIGPFKKVHGILKFYLKNIEPNLELYVTPINFDPQNPPFPVSYPYDYSKTLSKKISLYSTQGIPEDNWVLTEGILDEKTFLEQVDNILKERRGILKEELDEFKSGAFFFYFDTLDIIQHMFWRYLDPDSSLYEKDSLYQDTIFKYYEKIDQIVGEVSKSLGNDDTLIILSDHGFNSFRRAVHLNRWLLENGYLYLNEGVKESPEFFADVDWSKTKAYALGFGGIYLNKVGREYYGIVSGNEAQALEQALINGLRKFQDPKDGQAVVKNVYDKEKVFQGPYINDAPDLFVGFNSGFRASWQTALGGVPNLLIEENKKKWSGDHLIDPVLVPGVIFINKSVALKDASIIDIPPTILGFFKINKPAGMQGKNYSQ